MELDEVDRRRGLPEWIVAGLVGGPERHVLRVQSRIVRGEPRDDGVLVDEQRVAGDQVAPIDPLADEHRVLERAVVVGHVDLVEAAVDPGELERRTANVDAAVGARHPIGRVAGGQDEVGVGGARRVGLRATAAEGAEHEQQREGAGGDRGRGHCREYRAIGRRIRLESCEFRFVRLPCSLTFHRIEPVRARRPRPATAFLLPILLAACTATADRGAKAPNDAGGSLGGTDTTSAATARQAPPAAPAPMARSS